MSSLIERLRELSRAALKAGDAPRVHAWSAEAATALEQAEKALETMTKGLYWLTNKDIERARSALALIRGRS